MAPLPHNIHATAIAVDGRGLLFVGPSGSGKSATAFDCLIEARISGRKGVLIADDQVLVHQDQTGQLLARRPDAIAGLIELRFSGLVQMASIAEADLHLAIQIVDPNTAERLPADHEIYSIANSWHLPLIRIPRATPYPLARIDALFERNLNVRVTN